METKETERTGRRRPSGDTGRSSRPRRRTARRDPNVMYTQPGPFNRNRFFLHLASIVAVVLAVLFGISIFFKVDTVTVSGNEKYTQWDVYEASGIQKGENLLTLSRSRYCSNIRTALPYVESVRIGIKLPGTVKIEVKELDVVYAVEDENSAWWLMRADGGIVDAIGVAESATYTKIIGVQLSDAQVGQPARAAVPVSDETLPDGTPAPVVQDTARQLEIAISILQSLESTGLIGDMASVDVTDTENIVLWYAERFQIELGDSTQLSKKLGLIKTAVESEMKAYDSGVLDVSFRVKPDPERNYDIIFTPFPEES
ncbi:MAG: FtsQ-type POTRA domain-containing protein [Oscillospiraceae bacterium]|nr:FtsQ-type POTRA domain-containing protein [Oscillospiraceae bacterium]